MSFFGKFFGTAKDEEAKASTTTTSAPSPEISTQTILTKEEQFSMADKKYVAAIDQGTTSTRCMLFTKDGRPAASYQMEHEQIFPHPG